MPITTDNPYSSPTTLGVSLTKSSTTPSFEVGTCSVDQAGNMFTLVLASTEAITAGSLVTISSAGVVTLADSNGDRVDGFAPYAIPLNSYGWVGVKGDFSSVPVATGLSLGNFVSWLANASAQMKAVPGTFSAADCGYRGVVLSAPSGNLATVRLL